jgi:hypothetical protein
LVVPSLCSTPANSWELQSFETVSAEPPNSLASTDDGTDTNGASQSALNAIAVLEFCADVLPTAAPVGGGRGARGGGN